MIRHQTESQIEIAAERDMDRLDHRFMRGDVTQEQYYELARQIDQQATRAYQSMRRT